MCKHPNGRNFTKKLCTPENTHGFKVENLVFDIAVLGPGPQSVLLQAEHAKALTLMSGPNASSCHKS